MEGSQICLDCDFKTISLPTTAQNFMVAKEVRVYDIALNPTRD